MYYGLRYPKTHQEMKANLDGYSRAGRSPKNLPCSWDDAYIRAERSWKNFRDKQYKVVNKFDISKKDSTKYGKHMSRRDHFWREHRRCSNQRWRCKYCIKNDIWDDILLRMIRENRRMR